MSLAVAQSGPTATKAAAPRGCASTVSAAERAWCVLAPNLRGNSDEEIVAVTVMAVADGNAKRDNMPHQVVWVQTPRGCPQGGRSQRRLLTDKPATRVGSARVALSHVGTRPQLTDTAWRIIQNEVHHWRAVQLVLAKQLPRGRLPSWETKPVMPLTRRTPRVSSTEPRNRFNILLCRTS